MANPLSMLNVLNGTETTQSLLQAAGCTVAGRPISGAGANVVNTTATILGLTAALHANKILVVDSAASAAFTLPAATGTGDVYTIIMNTPATGTSSTIATAASAETLTGFTCVATGSTPYYVCTATDNLITIDGTVKGGKKGDVMIFTDIKASTWSLQMRTAASGSTVTPFSHV